MRYHVYCIDEKKRKVLIDPTGFPKGKTIDRCLLERGFVSVDEDESADLIIFKADHPDFYKVKYLHQLLDISRETSKLDKFENTTKPKLDYLPVLTVYSGDGVPATRNTRFGIQFWDTSIWQRWVNTDSGSGSAEDMEKELNRILYQLSFFFSNGLYQKDVSLEYCDFVARIYKNSFLMDMGTESCHANYITPFPFFSESGFFPDTEEIKSLNGLVWRVLLVDDDKDYKYDYLKSLLGEYQLDGKKGGFQVIDLNAGGDGLLNSTVSSNAPTLLIKQVFSLEEASKELVDPKVRYDVILLDYLLGPIAPNSKERHTGRGLLDQLKKDGHQFRAGIGEKFWIFLTTSYPTAFLDDLQHDVTALLSDHWNIDRGASFIQTPNYFLSALTGFLQTQLKATRIRKLKDCWKDCLKKLEPAQVTFSRGWANESLTHILNNWAEIAALSSLRTTSPENENPVINCFADRYLLSEEFQKIQNDYDRGLYNHLTQLLSLLSFSDGFEWEKMKMALERVRELTCDANQRPQDLSGPLKDAFKKINDHIVNLKRKFDP